MKLLVINRKRLGVSLIIIVLMTVLFLVAKGFDGRLKNAALIQNNIDKLSIYKGLDGKLNYKLPSQWSTKEGKLSGNEIIYHNDFTSNDNKIHGFVQVWNLKKDLKTFLEDSKKISDEQNVLKEYNLIPINIKGKDGYMIEYTMIASSNIPYRAYEYFIRTGDRFIRFSFFMSEDNFKENMPTIFRTIVETLDYKN